MALDVRTDDSDIDALLGETIARVGESRTVLEASARLRTMIDAARGQPKPVTDPRTLPVRFTRLKAFASSAAHYLLACQDEVKNSIAIRMGAGFHAALFENRPLVCYDGRRAGKAWERFEKHHLERDAVILNEKEYGIAAGMVRSVRDHKRAMALLFDGTTLEHRIDWSFTDRACRSTPDAFRPGRGGWNVDLKSSRCTEPRWFAREALKRHYHAQLDMYDAAIEAETKVRPEEAYLVAVENAAPFNVTVVRVPPETLLAGTKLCRQWWERLLAAEAANYYGGYVETDIDLELPDEEFHPENVAVEIDGELVSID